MTARISQGPNVFLTSSTLLSINVPLLIEPARSRPMWPQIRFSPWAGSAIADSLQRRADHRSLRHLPERTKHTTVGPFHPTTMQIDQSDNNLLWNIPTITPLNTSLLSSRRTQTLPCVSRSIPISHSKLDESSRALLQAPPNGMRWSCNT